MLIQLNLVLFNILFVETAFIWNGNALIINVFTVNFDQLNVFWLNKSIFPQILSLITVFNIDKNQKLVLSTKSY